MNPNEKTLGQVARSSYDPYVIETAAWDHVAQAVIAEHERRKAASILRRNYLTGPDGNGYGAGTGATKPEWKLPDPPAGAAWHRLDWTADMLPDGYRPLLLGESLQKADEGDYGDGWIAFVGGNTHLYHQYHYRTTRPLPVKPDPFAAEKAAFAAGKTIQYKSQINDHQWFDCYIAPMWVDGRKYRIKPEPVMIPLGPDDVPPGSLHFCDTNGYLWLSIVAVTGKGICTKQGFTDFGSLFRCNTHKINRQDGLGWVPCSKIKPE